MHGSLLQQGMDLMIYGMGTVIVFLTLLVIATGLMSRFVQRYFPDPIVVAPAKSRATAAPSVGVEPKIQRVIEEAIRQHRQTRR